MLMTLFIMAFAMSGGLYLGTIAFSAYKFAEDDKNAALIFNSNKGLTALA